MTTHAAMSRFLRRNAELWIVFAVLAMVSGCPAVSAPEYSPYLQAGQLKGLLEEAELLIEIVQLPG